MRAITRTIEYHSRSDYVDIIPLYDLHFGNAACDENLIRHKVQEIRDDPNCWWIGGGDYGDFISRKDRRHREESMASWLHGRDAVAQLTRDYIVNELDPIKDKCLGLVRGNHEGDILRHYEVDIYSSLVDKMKPSPDVPVRIGIQGFIYLRLARGGGGTSWPVKIYLHHGYGGGRLEGGHALALGRIFKEFDCDIALMGHRHVLYALPHSQTSCTRHGKVYDRRQVAMFCGSFLKSYSEDEVYSEEKGYFPQPTGCGRIRIWPDKKKFEVTL